jgi:hypothetical protein
MVVGKNVRSSLILRVGYEEKRDPIRQLRRPSKEKTSLCHNNAIYMLLETVLKKLATY